ncbi:hypothetical protein KR018_006259, partial [Drosophila ironensis]
MTLPNFIGVMEELAFLFTVAPSTHEKFMLDTHLLRVAIQQQMYLDNSYFQHHLGELHITAAYVEDLNLDLPLNFQIFLPIRLPMPVMASHNERDGTVRLLRSNIRHQFFFGNALNPKCMNLLLQQELKQAVENLGSVRGHTGILYDLKYSAWCCRGVPFVHQVVAFARDNIHQRCIRFDFVLAIEFLGEDMPLPSSYNAPISQRWLAYGTPLSDDIHDTSEWSVLVPKWQGVEGAINLRNINTIIMLHRLLRAQHCHCYTLPATLKFGFALTTEQRGESFQNMCIADLMTSILGHLVFCNFHDMLDARIKGSKAVRERRLLGIQKQQMRAKGIYYVLARACNENTINCEFIRGLFNYIYLPPPP